MPWLPAYAVMIGVREDPGLSRTDDRVIQEITCRHFPDGFTITEARGGWWDPARRKFIRERSRQIQVRSGDGRSVLAWVRALGRRLRQKEILLVKTGLARTVPIPPAGLPPCSDPGSLERPTSV